MIEMLIIGSMCALGYQLNKDGKQNRSLNQNIIVSPNRIPSGSVIYDSNRVAEVDNYVRNLAAAKHADKVRQLFPLDYDKPINIYPDDSQSDGSGCHVNLSGGLDAAGDKFSRNVAQGISTNINIAAYNPETGHPFETTAANVDSSPMFRPAAFQQQRTLEFTGPVSLLTDSPLDMTHANMNPMFGKMVRQPGVSNDNTQVLLERYTGVPSSEDQGTYSMKREVLNPLPSNPENPQRANIQQVSDLYERAAFFVKPSHEYQTPVKSFRDLPMKSDVRIMPLSIDQVRGALRKQFTYSGVMIPGQKGSTRPMMPNLRKNRWDLLKETKAEDLLPGRSVMQGSSINVIPTVRNVLATQVAESNYMAPPTHWKKMTNTSSDMYKAQMEDQVTRRMEPFTPGFGVAHGGNKGPNTGVYMMRDPEKGFANERQGQPHQNIGPVLRNNVTAPDPTLRDTLAENTVGSINMQGMKNNTAWKNANLRLDPTNKAMNSDNPYRGLPHKNLGMGNRKHKIEPWVTTKETTEFSQQGNPKGATPAHMSYDAVFEMDTNKEVETDHYGIAKGQTTAPVPDGGERTIVDMEKLMVTDYMMAPTGPTQGMDRQKYMDSVDLDYNRVDFGNYYSGGKIGNGDDAKRSGQVAIKDEMVVQGRMNVPLRRDNPNDNLEMEANLRPEKATVQRRMIQRTQPKSVITDRTPMLTRVKNGEVLNPRLDVSTKIALTSDYCPWIKDKGSQQDTE